MQTAELVAPETVTDYRSRLIEAGVWDATDPRDPSQTIDAAWQVVTWLREHTSSFHIEWESVGSQWQIVLWTIQGVTTASAATAPEAICRAALATVNHR